MKKFLEATTTGATTGGGYNKVLDTDKGPIKRINTTSSTSCPCKNLPGKVVCGICNPKRK